MSPKSKRCLKRSAPSFLFACLRCREVAWLTMLVSHTTAHDDARCAFMTLPSYIRTREGEVHQLGSGPTPCRLSFGVRRPDMPVLFLNARYDYVCECTHSRLAEPMRAYCRQLTEETIRSGHWLAQEKPVEVNAALVKWLATRVSDAWPQPKRGQWPEKEAHILPGGAVVLKCSGGASSRQVNDPTSSPLPGESSKTCDLMYTTPRSLSCQ
jgi:hypothetical protein